MSLGRQSEPQGMKIPEGVLFDLIGSSLTKARFLVKDILPLRCRCGRSEYLRIDSKCSKQNQHFESTKLN